MIFKKRERVKFSQTPQMKPTKIITGLFKQLNIETISLLINSPGKKHTLTNPYFVFDCTVLTSVPWTLLYMGSYNIGPSFIIVFFTTFFPFPFLFFFRSSCPPIFATLPCPNPALITFQMNDNPTEKILCKVSTRRK